VRNLFKLNLLLHYFFASSTYFLLEFAIRPPSWLLISSSPLSNGAFPIHSFLMIVFLTAFFILCLSVRGALNIKAWYPDSRRSHYSASEYFGANAFVLFLVSVAFYLFFLFNTIIARDYGGPIAGILLVLLPIFILQIAGLAARLFNIPLDNNRVDLKRILAFSVLALLGVVLLKGTNLGAQYFIILFFACVAFVGRGVFGGFSLIVQNSNKNGKSIFFPDLNQSVLVMFFFMTAICFVRSVLSGDIYLLSWHHVTIAILIGIFATGLAEVFKNKAMSDGVEADVIEAFAFIKGVMAGVVIWCISNMQNIINLDFPALTSSFGSPLSILGLIVLMWAGFLWAKWRSAQ